MNKNVTKCLVSLECFCWEHNVKKEKLMYQPIKNFNLSLFLHRFE